MHKPINLTGALGAAFAVLMFAASPVWAEGEGGSTTISCPAGPWGGAFTGDVDELAAKMPVSDAQTFMELVDKPGGAANTALCALAAKYR